jgi:hypothetical protein
VFVGSDEVDVILTVGETLSNVLDNVFETVLPLLEASIALFAVTLTVTAPAAVGVMLAV